MSIHFVQMDKMLLRFDLKKILIDYESRTGVHISYPQLATKVGVSTDTIKSLATRSDYNPSLSLLAKICEIFRIDPRDYLEWEEDAETGVPGAVVKQAASKRKR